ncbi:hypothetical protein [Mycolicibacterium palauense]|uniref:hypothetical protein n=1 Tax=Mycolicibacterium palauense TaxID=2034511 RepID=UPI000BFEDF8C|nr:hypothetical protein [Mycolicibacterium palauense]
MSDTLAVRDRGQILRFGFEDLMRYHGPGSPGGVAHAFKVLQRAFALLSPDQPPPRREILVRTAFRGPGARDGIEAVTRAVTDGRFRVDRGLQRPDRGRLLEDFVFDIGIGDRSVTLVLRDGYVTEEFIDLARTENRTAAQESRLDELKARLARTVMAAPAEEVYEPAAPPG